MLEYTLYVLGGLFVLGFVINQSKTKRFTNTLTASRAKEVGIETTLTLFLRNPFYALVIVFIGLFEFIRISVGLVSELFLVVIDMLLVFNKVILQDHKSHATAYSFVLALHSKLSKEDLENIASAYDVPVVHLETIWREPTTKNVTECIYERNQYKHLNGPQLNKYLLDSKLVKELLSKIDTDCKEKTDA